MNNTNIPFRFYDHIAVIFPGMILTGIILFIYPEITIELNKINQTSSVIFVFVILVASYICGHTSYILSKSLTDFLAINQDKFKEFSPEKQIEIVNCIKEVYKNDFGLMAKLEDYRTGIIKGSELQIKNYCFSIVDHKQVEHDKFVSLADFSRSVSLNLLLVLIVFLISLVSGYIDGFGTIRNIILVIGLGVSSCLLFKRSIRFRMAADSIIYSSFLAYVRKDKIS